MLGRCCNALLLSLLLFRLPAQLTPYTPPANGWNVPWPTAAGPIVPLKRVAFAVVTGMRVPDLVAGGPSVAWCATSPHTRTEAFSFAPASAPTTHDFAFTRDAESGRDLAVCLSPAGLTVRKVAGGGIVDTPLDGATVWGGASRLRIGQFDGDGLFDVVAIDASGQTLVFGLSSAGYAAQAVGVGATIFDIAPVEWNGVASQEVAVLSSAGITVRNANGGTLASAPATLTAGALARIPGTPVDRLACAYDIPIGGQTASVLYVLRSTVSGYVEAAIDLGPRRPRAMTAGDIDGDGNHDLVLGYAGVNGLDVFVNQTVLRPGTPLFADDALGGFAVDLGAMPPLVGSAPAVADFDGDGDGDIAFARADGSLAVIENEHIFDAVRPQVVAIPLTYVTDYVDVEVVTPAPIEATHLETRVWRLELDDEQVVIGRAELNPPIQVDLATSNRVRIPLAATDILNGGFFCTVQFVSFDGSGHPQPRSPAALFRIVVLNSPNTALVNALLGLPASAPTTSAYLDGGFESAVNPIPVPPPPPPAGTTPPG